MRVLRCIDDVRLFVREEKNAGRRVGLVPTMGYLHAGHLSLIKQCMTSADTVLASIFVNPTQFGPGEDLDTYPRDEDGDLEKARRAGCAAVFMPSVEDMYPADSQTRVCPGPMADVLCGGRRPGHFEGVCTVVLKLLTITGCDVACFGEKDAQQLAIIRRMVLDLDLPVEVISGPIIRENDGLAMSSRNVYLNDEERVQARVLRQSLVQVQAHWRMGERDPKVLKRMATEVIQSAPLARIDYVEVCRSDSLLPWSQVCESDTLVAIAVYFGATRLIDNLQMSIENEPL